MILTFVNKNKITCRRLHPEGFSQHREGRIEDTSLVKYGGLLLSSGHSEDLLLYPNIH